MNTQKKISETNEYNLEINQVVHTFILKQIKDYLEEIDSNNPFLLALSVFIQCIEENKIEEKNIWDIKLHIDSFQKIINVFRNLCDTVNNQLSSNQYKNTDWENIEQTIQLILDEHNMSKLIIDLLEELDEQYLSPNTTQQLSKIKQKVSALS